MNDIERRSAWIQEQLQKHRPQFGFVAREIVDQVLFLDELLTAARTADIPLFKDAGGAYYWRFLSCWWSFRDGAGPFCEEHAEPDPVWTELTISQFENATGVPLLSILDYIVNSPTSLGDVFAQRDEAATEREIDRFEEWLSRQRPDKDDQADRNEADRVGVGSDPRWDICDRAGDCGGQKTQGRRPAVGSHKQRQQEATRS